MKNGETFERDGKQFMRVIDGDLEFDFEIKLVDPIVEDVLELKERIAVLEKQLADIQTAIKPLLDAETVWDTYVDNHIRLSAVPFT